MPGEWVDDDGRPVVLAVPGEEDGLEHARDLEEAGRVADMIVIAEGASGRSPDLFGDVLDVVLPIIKSQAEAIRLASTALEQVVLVVKEHEERFARLEQFAFGAGALSAPSVLDGDAREDLGRPLTREEDRARAQAIADQARREAAEMAAADLRGIDQEAPDAPPLPVVEDEVVIPVQGPKGGFR